ncbi:uncharacterized protein LOC113147309 [Cyclospora cayetanensis]|uniref:Uncharacterized protein LOC113147309 n=1 Tax=Cyclospora cayetanensis TaxID=88456 RepID=A0A6P6S1R9_9EIME|nr:uncharacterized protein LOC113147309 [Cyclospora cayetanensis]
MRSLCWLLLVCSFDAARVAVGNSQAVERAVGHAMSSVAKNSFPGVAEAAAKLLMGAFARSMDGIRGSKLVRELKYLVHPPSTDPESFKNAISGIGPGLVSYLGCIDRLGSDQRPSAVQVLSRDRCGSLLSSLSRQTPFRQPQTAFKRMEGLETKLQLISAVPESAPMNSPHGGPPNADPDNLTSAVRSVLAVFEEDLDKHYSSFARSLMSSSDHEEAKVFLRRIGPHLMAALQLAWETVERLPPAERTTHSRRLAAAARDLAQLDACAQEAANELQPLLEDYPVIAYNSTPPLTLAELQLTKFPQQSTALLQSPLQGQSSFLPARINSSATPSPQLGDSHAAAPTTYAVRAKIAAAAILPATAILPAASPIHGPAPTCILGASSGTAAAAAAAAARSTTSAATASELSELLGALTNPLAQLQLGRPVWAKCIH